MIRNVGHILQLADLHLKKIPDKIAKHQAYIYGNGKKVVFQKLNIIITFAFASSSSRELIFFLSASLT